MLVEGKKTPQIIEITIKITGEGEARYFKDAITDLISYNTVTDRSEKAYVIDKERVTLDPQKIRDPSYKLLHVLYSILKELRGENKE